ncbi:MAG: CoA-binding protein [Candidatus Omnitrophica bacterium]|nr:CoA-binding protein [Candidatus Omnitrophota bacterium]
MQDLVQEFLKQKKFAVAGSFRNKDKFAYKILMALKEKGYEVYPVNPRLKEVEGIACYASVKDIPVVCDVADLVTPPEATEKIVRQCKEKGIKRVWMQPGAQSEEAVKYCRENGIAVVYNLCIMMGPR